MDVTVTWDQCETRQATMEVPDDTPPGEVTRIALAEARERAREGLGQRVKGPFVGHVDWVDDDPPGEASKRFGGTIG